MKPGIYETTYGNAVIVTGRSKFAFDLDMNEYIPLEMVTKKFLRPIKPSDLDQRWRVSV